MDILAHGLWTYAIYKRKPDINIKSAVVWGMFPDSAIILGEAYSLLTTHSVSHSIHSSNVFYFYYATTHSLVIFASIYLLARLITGKWSKALLAWPIHIFIDMVGHIDNLTPFLFPISKVTPPPLFSWENPTIILINYFVLLTVLFLWPLINKKRI